MSKDERSQFFLVTFAFTAFMTFLVINWTPRNLLIFAVSPIATYYIVRGNLGKNPFATSWLPEVGIGIVLGAGAAVAVLHPMFPGNARLATVTLIAVLTFAIFFIKPWNSTGERDNF